MNMKMQNTNIMTHVAISVRNNHNVILFFAALMLRMLQNLSP